ncbi:MAG TPA: nucleoside triphosphate pyrophosphatase [Longimicrobiales bacterium]|nr:nucleoside triphosphate pyrophosphatase [Longimicrobiales bacterium]
MSAAPRIILASQSPRRADLLRMLGLTFETMPADIDETYRAGEKPAPHAERLARGKTRTIAARVPDAVIIGSDTVVVVDGEVLGKPRDHDEAVQMLMRLQGREHEVATGIAVCVQGTLRSAVERVRVRFRPFNAALAGAYAATGEPMDKAGAYGIQGFGATLVERIEGDFFAVMGLPICRMIELLESAGFTYDFEGLKWGGPGFRQAAH